MASQKGAGNELLPGLATQPGLPHGQQLRGFGRRVQAWPEADIAVGGATLRRFKDELHEEFPDLLPAWNTFRDTRARRRTVQWLADNSLIDDAAATQYLTEHPDPDLP
jgi:hypothetical protein